MTSCYASNVPIARVYEKFYRESTYPPRLMARKNRENRGLFEYALGNKKFYGVRLWARGRAYKWQAFRRIQDARTWYEDRKRDLREGRPFPGRATGITFAEIIDHYLAEATQKKNYHGEQNYGAFWKARRGHLLSAAITVEMLEQDRRHLLTAGSAKKRPRAHATINRYCSWAHHVLQIEVESGRLLRNPFSLFLKSNRMGGRKFTEPKAPEVEFTVEELDQIMRELGDQAEYPIVAVLTGLREGEQFGLAWADLDLARGQGFIHGPKGGAPEVFRVNQEARLIFDRLRVRANGSPWVFPHSKDPDRPLNPASWYTHVFKPAARRAGVHISRKDGKTWHTLRHTFASWLQKNNVSVKDIKDLGRWKTWRAMDRYLKRDQEQLRLAIEKLSVPRGTASEPPPKKAGESGGSMQRTDI